MCQLCPTALLWANICKIHFAKWFFNPPWDYYEIIRFVTPWTGYFVLDGKIVKGTGEYKGAPVDGKVEIACGTVPEFEGLGVSSGIYRFLIDVALAEQPDVIITARTLRKESASTSILKENRFVFAGEVLDSDDGLVWEWVFEKFEV